MSMNVNSLSGTSSFYSDEKRKERLENLKAVGAGCLASQVIAMGAMPINIPMMNRMAKITTAADANVYRGALESMINGSALKNTGLKLVDLSKDKSVAKEFDELFKNCNPLKKIIIKMTNPLYQATKGKNAAYLPMLNNVYVDIEKMGASVFHELGHALNFNTSKFWKTLQLSRMPVQGLVIPALLLTAVLKKPKKEGEQPQGFWDKTTTFIKNNVGKLTGAAMLPMLAEEIKASLNGQKYAKKLLSPELYKKVVKSNTYGAISYALVVAVTAIGAWAGNKIADKIREKAEAKKAQL